MTALAITALLALLALTSAYVRQGGQLARALGQLAAAEAAAYRWRKAHELLAKQLTRDVAEAIDQAVAITREARRPLPMPADLDQVEAAAWADIVSHLDLERNTDA